MRRGVIYSIVLIGMMLSCKKEPTSPLSTKMQSKENTPVVFKAPENVIMLENVTWQKLVKIEKGVLVFNKSATELFSLVPGEIIFRMEQEGDSIKSLAWQVDRVKSENNYIYIEVSPVPQWFEDKTYYFTLRIPQTDFTLFEIPINRSYGFSGQYGYVTLSFQGLAQLNSGLNPGHIVFYLKLKWGFLPKPGVESIYFVPYIAPFESLTVSLDGALNISKKWNIFSPKLPDIVDSFKIETKSLNEKGEKVPIVLILKALIHPYLDVYVGVDVNAQGSVTTTYAREDRIDVGFQYQKDRGFSRVGPSYQKVRENWVPPSLNANAQVKPYVEIVPGVSFGIEIPKVDIGIDLVKGEVSGQGYLRLAAQYNGGQLSGDVYAGVYSEARVEFLNGLWSPDPYELYSNEWLLFTFNTWREREPLSSPRGYMAYTTYNNKIYVFGGTNGSQILKISEVYDPASNSWQTLNSLKSKCKGAAAAPYGNKIYVIGGYGGSSNTFMDSVQVFDPVANSWQYSQYTLNYARDAHAAVSLNNYILVIGGKGSSGITGSVEKFSGSGWTNAGNLNNARAYPAACVDPSTNVAYVLGGVAGFGSYVNTVEKSSNGSSWTIVTNLQTQRAGGGAVVVNGKLYFVGGEKNNTYYNVNEVLDLSNNTWSVKQPMLNKRAYFAIGSSNGKIYSIGGYNGNYLTSVEEYSP